MSENKTVVEQEKVTVNLDDIETTKSNGVEPKIMITDELGVVLRYPDWNLMEASSKE